MDTNRVILDTDVGSDVSDLAAVFLYWQCAKKGYLHPQGVLMNTGNEQGPACLALAEQYVRGQQTPIGALGTSFLNYSMHWKYTRYLLEAFPLPQPPQLLPYVPCFRKALADAPDQSVTIVCNGPLRGLAQLLRSGPDAYADVDGCRLVARKVRRLILSSGRFRLDPQPVYPRRSGWDVWSYTDTSMYIDWDVPSARIVDDEWPTPIVWVGCEVGYLHLSGRTFCEQTADDHPLRLAYRHFTKGGAHISGPQLAVLCALPAYSARILLSPPGRVLMNDECLTEFFPYAGGRDRHVSAQTPEAVFRQIDDLLLAR